MHRKFDFSAFVRAVRSVAARVYRQLLRVRPVTLMCTTSCPRRRRCGRPSKRPIAGRRRRRGRRGGDLSGGLRELADLTFSYFGEIPTAAERRLGRHPPRDDISGHWQSMSYASFVHLRRASTCTSASPTTGYMERTRTHSTCHHLFCERGCGCGQCGRSDLRGVERGLVGGHGVRRPQGRRRSSLLQVAESGTYSFRSAEDKLFNLFRHMARALPRTVPRFVNGPVMSGVHDSVAARGSRSPSGSAAAARPAAAARY